jgi:hypothetical protein
MHEAIASRRRSVQEQQREQLQQLCVTTRQALTYLPKTFDTPSVERLRMLLLDLEHILRLGVTASELKVACRVVAQMGQPLLHLLAEMKQELTD